MSMEGKTTAAPAKKSDKGWGELSSHLLLLYALFTIQIRKKTIEDDLVHVHVMMMMLMMIMKNDDDPTWKCVEVGGESKHCDHCRVKAWACVFIMMVVMMTMMVVMIKMIMITTTMI